jgi:hypothetical protein
MHSRCSYTVKRRSRVRGFRHLRRVCGLMRSMLCDGQKKPFARSFLENANCYGIVTGEPWHPRCRGRAFERTQYFLTNQRGQLTGEWCAGSTEGLLRDSFSVRRNSAIYAACWLSDAGHRTCVSAVCGLDHRARTCTAASGCSLDTAAPRSLWEVEDCQGARPAVPRIRKTSTRAAARS